MHPFNAHRAPPVAVLLLITAGVAAPSVARSIFPLLSAANHAGSSALPAAGLPALADAAPRDYPGLQNVVAYHEGFFSGGVPLGDAAFDRLQAWGVRTIISVDGAEPDVTRAAARDLRYVHLPIGYNGFDDQRRLQLARAVRDAAARGPVYIHCHHGKHRSAGAAAAVAVSLGWSDPDAAVARMKVSGTAENYRGLYACAREARPVAPSALNAVAADFPSVARPAGMVRAMIEIDEAHDRLKLIAAAGWTTPADHPDLVPAAEAGRLSDLLRLLADDATRAAANSQRPPEFIRLLRDSQTLADRIEQQLAKDKSRDSGSAPAVPASQAVPLSDALRRIGQSCRDCHAHWRD